MSITFYCGLGSPFAWRVWLALEHKQLAYDLKLLSFQSGDMKTPEYLAVNPRGKVPALVEDGFALWESAAIVEYLEERFPERPLFPGDARKRAEIRRLVREIDVYLARSEERLIAEVLRKPEPDARVLGEVRASVEHELAQLETQLSHGGEWLAGPLSAADHALQPLLAMIQRLGRRTGQPLELPPRLQAWQKRLETLPYYVKTYPPHWKT